MLEKEPTQEHNKILINSFFFRMNNKFSPSLQGILKMNAIQMTTNS